MNKPLPSFVIRRGLPNVGRKLAAGRAVTVVYFGGSITQSDGYRRYVTRWLARTYPRAKIKAINAGIGGTGSDLGAFRLAQDVLAHKPDLLFVEFAVNDGGEGHDVRGAVEGIVRHTLRARPRCDLALVYTLAQNQLEDLRAGRLPPASRLHEPVAEHYGLVSINVGRDVADRLNRGVLKWEEFSKDSCHPTPRGHRLYAHTMARALTQAFAAVPSARRLPAPLTRDPWEGGRLLTVDPRRHRFAGWSYRPLVNRGGWECFDGVLESDTPGAEASFPFRGTAVGLYYFLGPDSGDVSWSVDGRPFRTARVFDHYAVNFTRPSYRVLVENLKPGKHVLRIRVGPRHDRRSKGRWIRLAHVLLRGGD